MAHPVYERIREEVLAEHARTTRRNRKEVLASLEAKLDLMHKRRLAEDRHQAAEAEARGLPAAHADPSAS